MANNVTTTRNSMFRVEDVSTKGLRKQSEIDKEIARERGITPEAIPVPVSLTPESVKTFFSKKKEEVSDANEKKVYDLMIKWVDELADTKKKLASAESKLAQYATQSEEQSPDDII